MKETKNFEREIISSPIDNWGKICRIASKDQKPYRFFFTKNKEKCEMYNLWMAYKSNFASKLKL